jgi:hypothetical protein
MEQAKEEGGSAGQADLKRGYSEKDIDVFFRG